MDKELPSPAKTYSNSVCAPWLGLLKSLFISYPVTIQIIPAEGWNLVYVNREGQAASEPLIGWKLVEDRNGHRRVNAQMSGISLEDTGWIHQNFVGFAFSPFKAEEWEARVEKFKAEQSAQS